MSPWEIFKAVVVAIVTLAVVITLAFPGVKDPFQSAAYLVFGILIGGGVIKLYLSHFAKG